jgi:hypothetical protein
MKAVRISGTENYAEGAPDLLKRYESISFADHHRLVMQLIPTVRRIGSQVRTRLAVGGRRIRTSGSSRDTASVPRFRLGPPSLISTNGSRR